MRFVFLQPELRSKTNAHFYQYIQAVSYALAERGYDSTIIANEIFYTNAVQQPAISFTNHSSRYSNPIAVLCKILYRNFATYGEFCKVMRQSADQDPASIFFVDTILNERIIALAFAFRKIARQYPSVKMGVVFRFTYRSNSEVLTKLQQWLHTIFCSAQNKLIQQKRSLLFTDSVLLQKAYQQNIAAPIGLMPIPLRSEVYKEMHLHRQQRKTIRKIGFIGGTIGYKGLDKFLVMFTELADQDTCFMIHGVKSQTELLDYAMSVLNEKSMAILTECIHKICLYSHLDEKEYLALFAEMDIILIPYTSLQFAEGTSNIFAESVAAGVIPIVPLNTWMAAAIAKGGLSELSVNFNDHLQPSAVIKKIMGDFPVISEKMNRFSVEWRAFHDAGIFADRLIQSVYT